MAIPTRDSALSAWADNFDTLITASPVTYGLAAGDAGAIAAVVGPFVAALAAYTPQSRTAQLVADKNNAKAAMLAVLRPYYRMIQSDASVSDSDKLALGITLLDGDGSGEVFLGTQAVLDIVAAGPGVHKVRYRDTTDLSSHKKPTKAMGLMLHRTVEGGPVQCVGMFTRNNQILVYDADERGKNVTYVGNWVSTTGTSGPDSAPVTIAVP